MRQNQAITPGPKWTKSGDHTRFKVEIYWTNPVSNWEHFADVIEVYILYSWGVPINTYNNIPPRLKKGWE